MEPREKEVLLIDDEPGFHELFGYLLEPRGIKIDSAYDGLEGLGCSSRKDYAIIFLDIHMPKMLGTDVLRKIKEMKPYQRVVLLSSNSDPTHLLEEKANSVGIEACLEKPFDTDRVLAIVERIMGVPTRRGT